MASSGLMAFLKKVGEDEGLRGELTALAGRYGIQIGADELSDAALGQVAGGLLPASPSQTTLSSTVGGVDMKKWAPPSLKLGDGSV